MKRRCLLACLFLALSAPVSADPAPAPLIRIQRDSARGLWGLETVNARLADIAKALSRSLACEIELDEKAADARVTTFISPRSPERLVPLLGRRANIFATLHYRFGIGEAVTPSPPGFGKELLTQDFREPMEVEDALRALRLSAEIAPEVRGKVRLNSARVPLHRVLDQIAAQSGSKWSVVIHLKARTAADEIAAREDEPRFFYSDLARLTAEERREEIGSDLEFLMELPNSERETAVKTLAGNLSGMTTLVREAQENRGTVTGHVTSIARDFDLALRRLPSGDRAWAAPLFDALRELSLGLRSIQ